jgi:endonuclease/exonuclease/phosphatase family metal-dependent hydrolase
MKLMQLNAWGGRLEPQIGDLLKDEKPDIVCLQEASSFAGQDTGLFITIEAIQSQFNLPCIAFAPAFSFNFMNGTAKFGNAILSRYPITKTEVVFTHLEHKNNFVWSEDSSNMRNFVHTVIDVEGDACNVLTHHGFWVPDHKNGTPETLEQMRQLAGYIEQLEGPVILTGDFNLAPHSESLEQINGLLENLSIANNLPTTRTELTYKTETCDYIFVSDSITVENFTALDKIASDHKALTLEFTI